MGDQTYSVTHRIDDSGNEETREDLVNIDKGIIVIQSSSRMVEQNQ